jgi:group I intron endonuclease
MAQGVYAIINSLTDCQYIGSSKDCMKRFRQHWLDLQRGKHINRHLQAAWRKYGADAFYMIVLEDVESPTELLNREQEWLKSGDYNLAPKADRPPGLGRRLTEEEKAHLSEIHRGKPKPWQKGTKQSEEFIRRRIESSIGRKRTPEQCARISAALKGRSSSRRSTALIENKRAAGPKPEEVRKKIRTTLNREEVKAKLSAAHKGKKQSPEHIAKRIANYIGAKRTPEMRERMRQGRLRYLSGIQSVPIEWPETNEERGLCPKLGN